MTPFGARLRALRKQRGLRLGDLAAALQVTPAYLSALEHGHRGVPGPGLVLEICGHMDLIWEEAEDLKQLAALSDPKATVRTGGLSPKATEVANRLAARISELDEADLDRLLKILRENL